jgi:anti-sigma regulatory factor (Ser/Thr protein kinase)/predicted transcriptional regulator
MFSFFSKLLKKFKKNNGSFSPSPNGSEDYLNNQYDVLIAVYDSPAIPPRVVQLSNSDCVELINNLSNETYNFSQEKGGKIPYVVIREVVENLIHANFKEAVVTILDEGNTIRVADQGPGILNKEKAFTPGFSTATSHHKKYIRGVGSGLPIIKESISYLGGQIVIEENLNKGLVITLSIPPKRKENDLTVSEQNKTISPRPKEDLHRQKQNIERLTFTEDNPEQEATNKEDSENVERIYLSERQKKIILLSAEYEELGPSTVSKELNISLSTAYRELVNLEKTGLLKLLENGKRVLTKKGINCLNYIFE